MNEKHQAILSALSQNPTKALPTKDIWALLTDQGKSLFYNSSDLAKSLNFLRDSKKDYVTSSWLGNTSRVMVWQITKTGLDAWNALDKLMPVQEPVVDYFDEIETINRLETIGYVVLSPDDLIESKLIDGVIMLRQALAGLVVYPSKQAKSA